MAIKILTKNSMDNTNIDGASSTGASYQEKKIIKFIKLLNRR